MDGLNNLRTFTWESAVYVLFIKKVHGELI